MEGLPPLFPSAKNVFAVVFNALLAMAPEPPVCTGAGWGGGEGKFTKNELLRCMKRIVC